ncbi:MAG: S1 RNA-binding domain-containing protein [Anaerolineae bacterium]|nr:S1 RNA-binding domain-containing protein [Anaerolineae bacterium]
MEQNPEVQREQLAALIEGDYDYKRLRHGEICEATILSVDENQVIVDLGVKRDGIVPLRDLELLDDAYRNSLQVGERVPISVLSTSDQNEDLLVSLNLGLAQRDWLRGKELEESGQVCEAEVVEVNRGGVLIQFGRLQGFVPNSHLTSVSRGLRGEHLDRAKSDLVGQTLSLTVLEVVQRQRRFVLSERAAQGHMRQQLFDELNEGDVRTGTVRSLAEFGAFVDLGGVDGLLHISELAWEHVEHPDQVLSVGEKIQVCVLSVDRERERIGLSRKRLLPDPWPVVVETLHEGQMVEGIVTKIFDFGALFRIAEGVEGLVHISEMPDEMIADLSLVPDSPIQVRVLRIDTEKRRISLSLRQTA